MSDIESVFQILDTQLNNLDNSNGKEIKMMFLSRLSKDAYEHFDDSVPRDEAMDTITDSGLDATPIAIEQYIFHYGFQYGFSAGNFIDSAMDDLSSKIDMVKAEIDERKQKESEPEKVDGARLAAIVVDRDNNFIQVKIGNKVIVGQNLESIEVIEL